MPQTKREVEEECGHLGLITMMMLSRSEQTLMKKKARMMMQMNAMTMSTLMLKKLKMRMKKKKMMMMKQTIHSQGSPYDAWCPPTDSTRARPKANTHPTS